MNFPRKETINFSAISKTIGAFHIWISLLAISILLGVCQLFFKNQGCIVLGNIHLNHYLSSLFEFRAHKINKGCTFYPVLCHT